MVYSILLSDLSICMWCFFGQGKYHKITKIAKIVKITKISKITKITLRLLRSLRCDLSDLVVFTVSVFLRKEVDIM